MPAEVPIQLGPVIDVTPEVAEYYRQVCNAWESGQYTQEEMAVEFPGLTQADACEWSIRGFTIDHWLNLEITIQQLKQYTQNLRDQIRFYQQQLRDRYETMSE